MPMYTQHVQHTQHTHDDNTITSSKDVAIPEASDMDVLTVIKDMASKKCA